MRRKTKQAPLWRHLDAAERAFWRDLVEKHGTPVRALAKAAGVSAATCWRRMSALGYQVTQSISWGKKP